MFMRSPFVLNLIKWKCFKSILKFHLIIILKSVSNIFKITFKTPLSHGEKESNNLSKI